MISPPLTNDWFNRPSPQVAVDLIGCTLARRIGHETVRGQIVETEAYEAGDPAMYAYQRKTERNAVVFGPAGVAYIYRIYRQYHCFNIVTDRDGFASTILIRAVHLNQRPSWHPSKSNSVSVKKPEEQKPEGKGADSKSPTKKKTEKLEKLAAGPGKLCIALQLDTTLRGASIHPDSGLWVEPRLPTQTSTDMAQKITQTTRIGLSKGADIPWRWYLTDSPAVSRK